MSIDWTAIPASEQLRIIEADTGTLKRKARTRGGELGHVPCPLPGCGGEDRFYVEPNHPDGKLRYFCRQCTPRGGDILDYLKAKRNMTTEQAIAELGIKPTNGNGNGHKNGKPSEQRETIATYQYHDESGALLYEVDRVHRYDADGARIGKDFPSYRIVNGRRAKTMDGARRVLYRLPALIAADPALPIVLCEGEKLVHRFDALGFPATTLSGGAMAAWQDDYAAALRDRHVWIVPDRDKPGLEYARRAANGLLGKAASVKIIDLPGLTEGQDAEYWFEAGNTPADFAERAAGTPIYRPELNLSLKWLTTEQVKAMPPVKYLISEVMPEHSFTMLLGASGAGKSFVAVEWSALLACAGATVLYVATEGQHGFGKRIAAWEKHNGKPIPPMKLLQMHEALNLLDDKAMNALLNDATILRPALIVFDTLAHMLAAAGLDENSNTDMGKFINACDRIKQATGATVLIVHHPTKSGNWERGAGALRGACDMIVEVSNNDSYVTVSCSKSKDAAPFKDKHFQLIAVESTDSCVIVPSDKITWKSDRALTDNEQKALDVLAWETFIDVGCKSTMLAREARIPEGSIIRVLKTLMRRGLVKQDKRGEPFMLTEIGKQVIGKG